MDRIEAAGLDILIVIQINRQLFCEGDRAVIGPRSGVTRAVTEGETVIGEPATSYGRYGRIIKVFLELPEVRKQLNRLEKQLAAIAGEDQESG